MLFNSNPLPTVDESYKERNLYYKIFAGYIFNEFVAGYAERKERFLDLICKQENNTNYYKTKQTIEKMKHEEIHLDFDHHACQICKELNNTDRGEFADILICSQSGLIAIEAKLYSNWTFDKDINSNRGRIEKVLEKLHNKHGNIPDAIQVLLLSGVKLQRGQNNHASQYYLMKQNMAGSDSALGFSIITWEDLCEKVITLPEVKELVKRQLNKIVSVTI